MYFTARAVCYSRTPLVLSILGPCEWSALCALGMCCCPSSPQPAPLSMQRALVTVQVESHNRYRCAKPTFKRAACSPLQGAKEPESRPKSRSSQPFRQGRWHRTGGTAPTEHGGDRLRKRGLPDSRMLKQGDVFKQNQFFSIQKK